MVTKIYTHKVIAKTQRNGWKQGEEISRHTRLELAEKSARHWRKHPADAVVVEINADFVSESSCAKREI